jgi:aconitase A
MSDSLKTRSTLTVKDRTYEIYSLAALPADKLERLPYSLKILLENLLRFEDGVNVTRADIDALLNWDPKAQPSHEISFTPARVILQDFTGVPCVVDLAAMREAIVKLGGQAEQVNPLAPVELVIDHSVQVDEYGSSRALAANTAIEFARNGERYAFLRWGQKAFRNFQVVPPNTGIVHQVNLEFLGRVVFDRPTKDGRQAYPDTLVGTDSHTTMINGLGVLGWGVGGIEAEAAMLGQPITMLIPQVVGFRLNGSLPAGATATDLVLTVTEMLRKKGVVDKFVEFFGDGLANLPLADRATIGNMAPEYGSTCGIFPIDEETIRYLELSGRSREQIDLVEAYAKKQGLWRKAGAKPAQYTDVLELDLGTVEPSLAGPRRPQDRVPLRTAKSTYRTALKKMADERAQKASGGSTPGSARVTLDGQSFDLQDGAVLIAAITSCTNTSNPSVMLGAGLLARNAHRLGLKAKPWVKTSLAPGSRVVTDYFQKAGLLDPLAAVGFDLVGYGCTTCIAAGTPVLLADGTSCKIEQMPLLGGSKVFGPADARRLEVAVQSQMMIQGERDCVSLSLQDGRTLVCTPDHQILCADGRWIRADELAIGRDRVVMGLEAPLDEPGADENGYVLVAGQLRFGFASEAERARTLAFARLLGHLLCDGSISVMGQGRMNVGQALDREAVLNDIERITGKRPKASRYDERKWSIVLPRELTRAIIALPDVTIGRRIDQPPTIPACVREAHCPLAFVREFLGGLFGADGHAPGLHWQNAREDNAVLGPPALSHAAKPEHVAQLEAVMRTIVELLVRCGVKARGARIASFPTRRSSTTYPPARDGTARMEVRLQLNEGLSFVERVGYRYCMDKALRASAAAVYWRTIDTINRQRLWMADRLDALHQKHYDFSFRKAQRMAATELVSLETAVFPHYSLLEGHDRFDRLPERDGRFKPLHRDSCGFRSPVELFRKMGARDWFAPPQERGQGDADKRYCLEKDAVTLPTFSLEVIDRRAAGTRPVFDIAVEGVHAFVAAGVCVHNCIGNSGPLRPEISSAVKAGDLVGCSVLSGNRNFEGRVHPEVRMNFLASPPLVVAYALAGTLDVDLTSEPLATSADGKPVYLKDLWPSPKEIQDTALRVIDSQMFRQSYASVYTGDKNWSGIAVPQGNLYSWDGKSTYVKNPPYFEGMSMTPAAVRDIHKARVLALLGDSVTTDHISPAGNIAKSSPAAQYLVAQGVQPVDFNSYGARRGNHEVMLRGTFANIRLRNLLAPGTEGGVTIHVPSGAQMSIYDAAMRYKSEGTPLIVLAGREYGTGSSRDWAAKGTMLLGVRAVIAESFERIHRSNLIGMGVLPLQFAPGQNAQSLGLTGNEVFDITGLESGNAKSVKVSATAPDGRAIQFEARVRIDTPKEQEYFRHGGILQYVLRQLASAKRAA